MKTSKLLNKKFYLIIILIFFYLFSYLYATDEPVDIWKLEKSSEEKSSEEKSSEEIIEENSIDNNSTLQINNNVINQIEIIDNNKIEEQDLILGLYDPVENGLKIDMWLASDGIEIKNIFKRINKIKLSKDANQILEVALLTNSYFPNKNISESEFIDFKINYLIKKKDKELIRNYLEKKMMVINIIPN